MPAKCARAGIGDPRVILIDPNLVVGVTIGDNGRPVIKEALSKLSIETRLGASISGVDARGVTLSSGELIAAQTVVWCAGMAASPLAATLAGEHDRLGRLAVDSFMRAKHLPNVFAAGDVASCLIDGVHATVMSCQFARPMGRFAGHNVMADLFGQPMLQLGRVVHGRLGSAGACDRRGCQADQADHQSQAHLSAAQRQPRRAVRCRRADHPGGAGDACSLEAMSKIARTCASSMCS